MSARFPNMIGIFRTCIKTNVKSFEVPANKLCINVLRLLRDQGYLWGFNIVSPKKRTARLYPRVKVHLKASSSLLPVIKDVKVFKNTYSSFKNMHLKGKYHILTERKVFLLTTSKGLVLTSFAGLYQYRMKSREKLNAKALAEFIV